MPPDDSIAYKLPESERGQPPPDPNTLLDGNEFRSAAVVLIAIILVLMFSTIVALYVAGMVHLMRYLLTTMLCISW